MIRFIKTFSYIFVIFFLMGCTENSLNLINAKYNKAKEKFTDKFLSHFPKEINTLRTTVYTRTYAQYENACFYLTQETNQSILDSINQNLKEKSISSISATDSCLLIVNRFHTEKDYAKRISVSKNNIDVINKTCYENKLPQPNFYGNEYYSKSTKTTLSNDFKIYILESHRGKYWDDKYLYGGEFMPEGWKHGYSKGIAISQEKSAIIYWFIIW